MGSTPFGRAIFYLLFREVAQLGRALGLGPRGRRFESCLPDHLFGALAQLGERLPCTQEVSGSIPLGSTICSLKTKQDNTSTLILTKRFNRVETHKFYFMSKSNTYWRV